MIDPKWLVIGVALISAGLVFNYDLRLGQAVSVLLAGAGAFYLWISFRLTPTDGEPRSERDALLGRMAKMARNRELARAKELGAQRGTDSGKGA